MYTRRKEARYAPKKKPHNYEIQKTCDNCFKERRLLEPTDTTSWASVVSDRRTRGSLKIYRFRSVCEDIRTKPRAEGKWKAKLNLQSNHDLTRTANFCEQRMRSEVFTILCTNLWSLATKFIGKINSFPLSRKQRHLWGVDDSSLVFVDGRPRKLMQSYTNDLAFSGNAPPP